METTIDFFASSLGKESCRGEKTERWREAEAKKSLVDMDNLLAATVLHGNVQLRRRYSCLLCFLLLFQSTAT